MPFPIFNPTTEIAVVMPGARLVIGGIYIKSGVGRDNAIYNNACCGSYTHLDLEQYSDAEMRKEGGAAVSQSGYKLSSLVANPGVTGCRCTFRRRQTTTTTRCTIA